MSLTFFMQKVYWEAFCIGIYGTKNLPTSNPYPSCVLTNSNFRAVYSKWSKYNWIPQTI